MFYLGQPAKPGESGIIDGFRDIVAEIESTMVTTPKDQHKLPWSMLCLGDFELWYFPFEEIGIDEGSLMPEMFRTPTEVFGKVFLCLPLQ